MAALKVVIVGLTFCVISTDPVSAPSEKNTVSSAMNEVGAEVVLSTQLSVVDQLLPASPFQIGQAFVTTRLIAPCLPDAHALAGAHRAGGSEG